MAKSLNSNISSREYGDSTMSLHFGKSPKKKFSSKAFRDVIEGAHISGKLDAISAMELKIKECVDRDESPEIIMGDIQLMLRDTWNEFADGVGKGKVGRMHDIDFLLGDRDASKLCHKRQQ